MSEAEVLSLLIEAIYDSVLDPARWPVALGAVTRFVGGCSTGLYLKDAASRSGMIYYQDTGMSDADISRYFDTYIKLDPLTVRHYFMAVGDIAATLDFMPYAEFEETRVYREWASPLGLVDHLAAVLDKDQTSVSLLGVFRSRAQGLVDEPMRRRMRLVVPHMRRAVTIGGLLERRRIAENSLAQALDAIRAAVFLIAADGTIQHANTAGLRLLAEGGPVHDVNGRLAGIAHDVQAALSPTPAAPSFEPVIGRDGEPYLVHILPLRGQRRDGAAAVFIHKAALAEPAAPEAMARAYQLTPAELRILLAIAEVGGVPQVAEVLGISETTVKFHLRSLYAKTGSARQADLVKLVAGFAGP